MFSVSHTARDTSRALSRYLHRDDAGPISQALTDPRCSLAFAVSGLGGALARLGHRIHRDAMSDYTEGFYDGQQLAGTFAAVTTTTTREDARKLLAAVDLPHDDDALDRLGWAATA